MTVARAPGGRSRNATRLAHQAGDGRQVSFGSQLRDSFTSRRCSSVALITRIADLGEHEQHAGVIRHDFGRLHELERPPRGGLRLGGGSAPSAISGWIESARERLQLPKPDRGITSSEIFGMRSLSGPTALRPASRSCSGGGGNGKRSVETSDSNRRPPACMKRAVRATRASAFNLAPP